MEMVYLETITDAIDHDCSFNSNSGKDLYQINSDDTILAHDLYKNIFKRRYIDHEKLIKKSIQNLDNFLVICASKIDDIFSNIPEDWNVDIIQKKEFIKKNLFSDDWVIKTKKNFKLLYSQLLRH